MPRFRKKPVEIEARQFIMGNYMDIAQWIAAGGYIVQYYSEPPMRAVTGLIIKTLEGDMRADVNDWIIKGVNGEFYPCKPDIFEKTYEAVNS